MIDGRAVVHFMGLMLASGTCVPTGAGQIVAVGPHAEKIAALQLPCLAP